MPLYNDPILALPAPSVDNQLVRWDGTSGDKVQGSTATLSDALILTLPDTTSQLILADTATGIVFSGVTLSPHLLIKQAGPTNPTMVLIRDAATASGAPTFNYFRSRASGAVNNGDQLGIFSGSGHDGTDYAAGAQIDITVDEADSGTAAVGSNQMGSMIRFLTSRRTTQSPTLSARIRHNGALQLNTITPLTAPLGGALESDGKVLYYTPEDANRGVVGAKYIICPTGTNVLTATTGLQALFDDVGAGTLTLPTGTYVWSAVLSFVTMEAAAATNLLFDLLGAGSATVESLWMVDGGDAAINTIITSRALMSNANASPNPILTGVASAALQLRIHGLFRVTAAGTIIPSVNLGTNGGTPTRSKNCYFMCECVGASDVQTVGQWS